ncbi:IS4 family transposase [Streptomyces sp. NBC_01233]|uniref:IS4 family transposase n=1 Tax=Streptomyces sp. NBC_01233 TaxID=2903787 RepID=UPI002E0D5CC5|nr:IS4 family transposase [Streptomyces sp. NBC_01233]
MDRIRLGDLDEVFPPELVDAVLAKSQACEVRVRLLPPRLMVYFALARALFCPEPYLGVLRTLAVAARHEDEWGEWRVPDKAAVFRARRKLGVEPMHELLVHTGTAVADARTPGAFWRGLRLMGVDGTTLPAAYSQANEAGLGRLQTRPDKGPTGSPLARVMVLVEVGSRAICDAAVDSHRVEERVLVERLARSFRPGMLVLADRGLPGAQLWQLLAATGADLLLRIPGIVKLPVAEVLSDGSWISTVLDRRSGGVRPPQDVRVRVIEYSREIACRKRAETYQLITTLMDPERAPTTELAALYGERWELDNTLAELETTQIGSRTVLPSKSPELVFQEIYAHLVLYTGVRVLMHRAAVNRSDPLDPGRLSFAAALRAARHSVTSLNREPSGPLENGV